MAEPYQDKIRKIVNHVVTNYIAEIPKDIYHPDRKIEDFLDANGNLFNGLSKSKNDELIPITTTLLTLNSCMGNNTLIEGGSGTGKTKLASVIGSIMYQLPIELFERKRVVGTPGSTVNEIYATHDLAELNKGKDVAFLYLPFYSPYLIIDELNRFSEIEQNRIREGVASDVWSYANHSWMLGKQLVISAVNPETYGGTFFLNENLLDNFSLVLEPAHYNPLFHANLVRDAESKIKADLGIEALINDLMGFYESNKNDPKLVKQKIEEIQAKTLKQFEAKKIPLINNGFVNEIKNQIDNIKFSPEGSLFFYSVLAEMTYSKQYGRLRSDDPQSQNSHDKKYLSTLIKEGLHGRFLKAWTDTSKAIAWYFKKSKVNIDDLKAAFIYTAPRRVRPQEDFRQKVLQEPRSLPVNFEIARQIIETAWANYSDFKGTSDQDGKTFNEIRKAIRIITNDDNGDLSEAIKILKAADHPLAKEVLEAVALDSYFNSEKK